MRGKRIVSILIALCMVFTLAPAGVYAGSPEPELKGRLEGILRRSFTVNHIIRRHQLQRIHRVSMGILLRKV